MIPRRALVVVLALAASVAPRAIQQEPDGVATIPAANAALDREDRGTGSVSGTVFVTGSTPPTPARRVRVTLNEVDHRVRGQTTTTDDNGEFIFSGVPAGRFELDAYRNGFLRASYGAARPSRPGTPVVVRDGEAIRGLNVSIAHGGVITGVVRDLRGRPVPDVEVRVMRLGYSATTGEPALSVPAGSTINRTDDRGEYRAYGLPPGGYLVTALPGPSPGARGYGEPMRVLTAADVDRALQAARTGGPAPSRSSGAESPRGFVSYTPIFHPGVSDISRAATVVLDAGEERTGVDIAIELVATSTVSGHVVSPDGALPSAPIVTVAPNGSGAAMLTGVGIRGMSATARPDGTYAVPGVIPGNYTVKAATGAFTGGRGRPAVDVVSMSGDAQVTVEGRDLDVPIILTRGVPIAGRVLFEGAAPAPVDLQTIMLELMPVGGGGAALASAGGRVRSDGTFEFASVPADAYYLYWTWTAPGSTARWSMKSATVDGRDVLERPLRVVAERPVDLTLTFTDMPSVLTGVFQDRSGRAATDYFIVVFSVDRAYWVPGSRRIRATRPATDGAFGVRGLPPGDYLLGAVTDLEPGEWNDPTLLADLSKVAIKVSLRDAQTTIQDIRVGR